MNASASNRAHLVHRQGGPRVRGEGRRQLSNRLAGGVDERQGGPRLFGVAVHRQDVAAAKHVEGPAGGPRAEGQGGRAGQAGRAEAGGQERRLRSGEAQQGVLSAHYRRPCCEGARSSLLQNTPNSAHPHPMYSPAPHTILNRTLRCTYLWPNTHMGAANSAAMGSTASTCTQHRQTSSSDSRSPARFGMLLCLRAWAMGCLPACLPARLLSHTNDALTLPSGPRANRFHQPSGASETK